jgi:hypothetical protein
LTNIPLNTWTYSPRPIDVNQWQICSLSQSISAFDHVLLFVLWFCFFCAIFKPNCLPLSSEIFQMICYVKDEEIRMMNWYLVLLYYTPFNEQYIDTNCRQVGLF